MTIEKVCQKCEETFSFTAEDEALLARLAPQIGAERFAIAAPTLCPSCRLQRRMLWRGELHLYNRKSALSGESFVSFYAPNAKGNVYSRADFWGDDWDARDYGVEFDFNRPFFEQFAELLRVLPVLGLGGVNNENSDYTNNGSYNKSCYLTASANYNEDCYSGNHVNHCKSCVDNLFLLRCELCHQCVSCVDCYNVAYSGQSERCSNSAFLFDCRRCESCFGCVNLVDASYCFFNEQLSADDYQRCVSLMNLHTRSGVTAAQEKFTAHRLKFPHRAVVVEAASGCTGDFLYFSERAASCFDGNNLQDCRHSVWLHDARDCMDIYCWGLPAELCYECSGVGNNAYHNLFCYQCNGSRDLIYNVCSNVSSDCFGCVGLKRQKFCILNKQYSEADYNALVPRIIELMIETKEWGEFFPANIALLPYNTTVANDYFPLSKDEVLAQGMGWYDEPSSVTNKDSIRIVPDSIDDLVAEDLVHPMTSERAIKPFKIIARELEFLQSQRLAPPECDYLSRHKERILRRNPRRLWQRRCAKCRDLTQSSYAADRPEIIYCPGCFSAGR